MLSILNKEAHKALTLTEVCKKLGTVWGVILGGQSEDLTALNNQGYHGFDEEDLRANVLAFAERIKSLNLAVEPSDGLILCATDVGGIL